jgi:hypothetical protein
VAVLGEGQPCMLGHVLDISGHGMALSLPAPIPPGSAIKIEYGDALVLGEVSYCTSHNGAYRAGLVVKHRLAGLADLHRLNRSLHNAALSQETTSLIMKR